MITKVQAQAELDRLGYRYYLLDNRNRQTRPQFRDVRRNGHEVIPQGTIHSYECPVTRSLIAAAEYLVTRNTDGSYHGLVGDDDERDIFPLAPVQCETWHSKPTNNWSFGQSLIMYAHSWRSISARSKNNLVKSLAYAFYVNSLELIALGKQPIPARFITRDEAMRGSWGFIFHRHTDPGRRTDPANPENDFPKEVFLSHYKRLMAPVLSGSTTPDPTKEISEMPEFLWTFFYLGNDTDQRYVVNNVTGQYAAIPGSQVNNFTAWLDKRGAKFDWHVDKNGNRAVQPADLSFVAPAGKFEWGKG